MGMGDNVGFCGQPGKLSSMKWPEGAGKGTRLRAAIAWCEYRPGVESRQKVPMSQASLPIVPLFSAGRGCFSPGFPQHALSCTNTAGGSAAEKGE